MRRVLPVGTASAGVKEIVIVTEPVFLATLLSEMDGALVPRDPLTIATIVPAELLPVMTLSQSTISAVTLDDAACGASAFFTVFGRTKLIGC
jgi:hypothetical protein